jgi:hypothetical protein
VRTLSPSLGLSHQRCYLDTHVSPTQHQLTPGPGPHVRISNPRRKVLLHLGRHALCGVPRWACPGDVHDPVSPMLRGLRRYTAGLDSPAIGGPRSRVGWMTVDNQATASVVGPLRGERCWRGRCGSCPTSLSLGSTFECRSGGCLHGRCFRRARWIPVEWVILHSLWAVGLG